MRSQARDRTPRGREARTGSARPCGRRPCSSAAPKIERQRELGAGIRIDEFDRAEFAEPLELGAVAAAGRGRALRCVELLPVRGKLRLVGAARIELHFSVSIGLACPPTFAGILSNTMASWRARALPAAAARCRARAGRSHRAQASRSRAPAAARCSRTERRRGMSGSGQNRGAQCRAATASACRSPRRTTTIAGVTPFVRADVALPGREPVEGLERRAVGGFFEAPPVLFDAAKLSCTERLICAGSARASVPRGAGPASSRA